MRAIILAILLLTVLLAACEQTRLVDNQPNYTLEIGGGEPQRPLFNRTPPPTPEPPGGEDNESVIPPPMPNQTGPDPALTTTLEVPIGWTLGRAHPLIDRNLVEILEPQAIAAGNSYTGYRQEFTLSERAGNITFLVDDDYIGSALRFAEQDNYLNFSLMLNNRVFYDNDIIASDITILAKNYRVMEATNFTLLLHGVDVEQYVWFEDGDRLETNEKLISDSIIHYDGHGFLYELRAQDLDDDGFWLQAGETLKGVLDQPEALLGSFDLRYEGLEELVGTRLEFGVDEEGIELSWDGPEGEVTIPFLGLNESGALQHGIDERLHLKECEDYDDGCIELEDLFVIQGVHEGESVTRLLEFNNIDEQQGMVVFSDKQTGGSVSLDYGADQRADLPFFDRTYRIHAINTTIPDPDNSSASINVTDRIAVDLDGDNRIDGSTNPIFIDGMRITPEPLLEGTPASHVMNLTIETPPYDRDQQRASDGTLNKERLLIQLVADDGDFSIRVPVNESQAQLWDQRLLLEPDDEDDSLGLSPWGSRFFLEEGEQETAEELVITVPFEQRFARVTLGRLEE